MKKVGELLETIVLVFLLPFAMLYRLLVILLVLLVPLSPFILIGFIAWVVTR